MTTKTGMELTLYERIQIEGLVPFDLEESLKLYTKVLEKNVKHAGTLELTFEDRMVLNRLLPQRGNIDKITLVGSIRDQLQPSDDELEQLKLNNEDQFEPDGEDLEVKKIKFPKPKLKILKDAVKQPNKRAKVWTAIKEKIEVIPEERQEIQVRNNSQTRQEIEGNLDTAITVEFTPEEQQEIQRVFTQMNERGQLIAESRFVKLYHKFVDKPKEADKASKEKASAEDAKE